EIAVRPLNVCGDVPAATSAAPSRLTRYGAVPPPKVAVTDPSLPPLQLTSTLVSVSVNAGGWPTVIDRVISQLLASTIRTECEIAVRPLNVCGEVPAATSAAPSRLTRYGAVPPPKVAVTDPSLPPL